jgi:DNA-binding transcriptional ArsR family regulator
LLNKAEHLSGYAEWVTNTAVSLTPQQLYRNKLVLLGLHYAVVPFRSWSSFEAYLANLSAHNPLTLRDRVLDAYDHMPCRPDAAQINRKQMLSSPEIYLQYLRDRFPAEAIDEDIERDAYALMIDPPQMQQTIIAHLRDMWETILKPEWARIEPLLQASVDAFAGVDFQGMTPLEAAGTVAGQELPEHWQKMLGKPDKRLREIIFVPSAHIGPYLGMFKADGTLWLLFGARAPEGMLDVSPDLSRSELLVRLNALADDTRLRILQAIHEAGELCSQEIMARLDLSQSAASRHLKQLSATGFLSERRRNGAKCYSLDRERLEDIMAAISSSLLN